jgi:hypothetical protein
VLRQRLQRSFGAIRGPVAAVKQASDMDSYFGEVGASHRTNAERAAGSSRPTD